jgi:hypothetical protein
MSRERGHIVTIRESEDHHPDDPDYRCEIECIAPEKCGGWWECMEAHEVDGVSAADGPYASVCPSCGGEGDEHVPWCDRDEFEFHGVEHTWRYGYGWTVPYEGCIVQANDSGWDDLYDIAREHGPGRYLVDDDWDDTTCYLTYAGEAPR